MSTNAQVLNNHTRSLTMDDRFPLIQRRGPNHCLERRRGCASRCAAASMVDSARVAPVISTHFDAATCSTAAVHAAALRKAAAASDGSQLRKRGRKAAGASTHRPWRSMSRCVSNAPLMRPPLSQRRRRHGQRRPSNDEFKPLPLATSANALWEKGLCRSQGDGAEWC